MHARKAIFCDIIRPINPRAILRRLFVNIYTIRATLMQGMSTAAMRLSSRHAPGLDKEKDKGGNCPHKTASAFTPVNINTYHRRYMAKALKPPSTTATVPVTNFAASLIR